MSITNWTKFARVVKVSKNLDFVVEFATKSIFMSEHLCELNNNWVCLVPPILDFPRQLEIESISIDSKKAFISFKQDFSIDDVNLLIDKWLLIDKSILENVLVDVDKIDLVAGSLISKKVFDKNAGFLGHVEDVGGTDTQRYLVVANVEEDKQILIPYVSDIVVGVDEVIDVVCPEGLLDLN